MRYLAIIALIILIFVAKANATGCAEGSYQIDSVDGKPICRSITNCPYGDSIPLDSPKCKAPDQPKEAQEEEITYPPINYSQEGK